MAIQEQQALFPLSPPAKLGFHHRAGLNRGSRGSRTSGERRRIKGNTGKYRGNRVHPQVLRRDRVRRCPRPIRRSSREVGLGSPSAHEAVPEAIDSRAGTRLFWYISREHVMAMDCTGPCAVGVPRAYAGLVRGPGTQRCLPRSLGRLQVAWREWFHPLRCGEQFRFWPHRDPSNGSFIQGVQLCTLARVAVPRSSSSLRNATLSERKCSQGCRAREALRHAGCGRSSSPPLWRDNVGPSDNWARQQVTPQSVEVDDHCRAHGRAPGLTGQAAPRCMRKPSCRRVSCPRRVADDTPSRCLARSVLTSDLVDERGPRGHG